MLFAHLKCIPGLAGYNYVDHAVQMTNSSSPQPPKTFANLARSFLYRSMCEKPERKGAYTQFVSSFSAAATLSSSIKSA